MWEDDAAAMEFLERRGYRLTRSWSWVPPVDHKPTQEELSAVNYLFDEWDYAGLEEDGDGST